MEQKTIRGLTLVSVILLSIVIAGCTVTPGTTNMQTVPPTIQTTPSVATAATSVGPVSDSRKSVADANNRFAFDLYSKIGSDPKYSQSNLFYSPFSISSALAITYEGARGTTADEIRSVFHFPDDDTARRQGYAEINTGMNAERTGYTLRTANALWAEKTYQFLPDYISTAGQYYGANVTNLDFISQPEDSRITINRWVEDKTENKIKDLIPAGAIDPLTRLVITNAVYFNGKWEKPFDENRTHDDEFRIAPGKTVRVRMMTDERYFGYTETDIFQVLDMPYNHTGGKELSLLVILPRGDNLTVAENSLGSQKLSDIRKSLAFQRVMVYFPKFRLETEYRLPATLKAMGMPTAFSGSADFSGMDGTHNLFISDVIHKAFVDVGEEGTEAAAATAVIIVAVAAPVQKPAPVPVFRADHPFIFLIQDKETGNILFVGRVMNPAGS